MTHRHWVYKAGGGSSGINPQITQPQGEDSDFSPAPVVAWPVGIGSDFSPASMCGQPACMLPELVEVEPHQLWALQEWGYYSVGSAPPFMCLLTVVFHFYGGPRLLLHTPPPHPVAACPTLYPLQAISAKPTPVLSLGLSSEAWVSAPSPCAHEQMCILGWGVQWGDTDYLCSSLSVLPAASWLLHSSLNLWSSLPVPADLLTHEGGFPGWGNLPSFTAPSQGHRSCHNSYFSLFFSFILHGYMVIFLTIFDCPRSCASIQ